MTDQVTEKAELIGGPCDGAVLQICDKDDDGQLEDVTMPHQFGWAKYTRRTRLPRKLLRLRRKYRIVVQTKFDYIGRD